MRRHFAIVAATVLCLACEDGPTQTYNPNGNSPNSADGGSSTDPATQGYTGNLGGQDKAQLCTAPQQKATWGKLFNLPIQPPLGLGPNAPPDMPNSAPGSNPHVNMAGDSTWVGLTVEQAEHDNCQSANLGDAFGDGNLTNCWGNNCEVVFEYRVSNRKIIYLGLEPGYTGTMDFHSPDGTDTFTFQVNSQILKNGQPYTMTWDFTQTSTVIAPWATELTNAIFATFAGFPPETNCVTSGHCVPGHFGDQGYIFLPALGVAWRVSSISAAQPTPSVVSYMDVYLEKIMPFSLAPPRLSLDASGPHAIASGLGPSNNLTCDLHMGMTYQDLLDNCINVSGDPKTDMTTQNKLLGGLTHSTERFHFDLSGVDVNFTDKTLPATDVVHDKDVPTPDDTGTSFNIDQSTLGAILNDKPGNDPLATQKDIHGTGYLYYEFIRLAQAALKGTHPIGDPACLTGDMTNPAQLANARAIGCTGLEGFVIPLDPALESDANFQKVSFKYPDDGCAPLAGATGTFCPIKNMGSGLKPGHQNVVFCDGLVGGKLDPATCKVAGDTFPTTYARVLNIFGGGKVSGLPLDAQDARFFWKQWATAFIKYTMSSTATDAGLTPLTVQNAPIVSDDLFFDSVGSGQFELAEYVDRRFAVAGTDPFVNSQDVTDLVLEADVKNGIIDAFSFSRDLFRGETAIYAAMRKTFTDPVAKEPGSLLTNVFGSPLAKAIWPDVKDTQGNVVHTGYDCATTTDCVASTEPPPMLNGLSGTIENNLAGTNPIWSDYPYAFTNGTDFLLGQPTAGAGSPITIVPAGGALPQNPILNIQSAMVNVPIHTDPGDYLSATNSSSPSINLLIPWLPKQPGVGFPIAISGTRDKFVETAQLDFSGTTITANIDYDLVNPKDSTQGIQFLAVETTSYLGEVFLCWDKATASLLHARMYSSVGPILDWISAHKTAADACGMIVRWSPYNNYPDYISSLTYGVRLGITQGGGYGRVVDTTLFVPGQ